MGACAQILGVTDGVPYADAGDGGDGASSDAPADARPSSDVRAASDARAPADGSARADVGTGDVGAPECSPNSISVTCQGHNCNTIENNCGQSVPCGSAGGSQCEHTTDICELDSSTCCTPDPPSVTCNDQCGVTLTNNCGQSVDCACGDSGVCLSGVCCSPASDVEWCANRCGSLDNNCGQPVDCGGCDGGICTNNSCNCNPDPPATTCAGMSCGWVQNNCNQLVPCGISGTTNCPGGQECEADSGTCCTPNPAPCDGVCDTTVLNCGQVVSCGTCPAAGVCVDAGCCTPELVTVVCEEAGASCGEVQNNCAVSVQCNDTCAADGGVCGAGEAGPNGCCVDDGTACNGLCSGTATNNCGSSVNCANACAPGQSCADSGSCCNVNATGCGDGGNCCNGNCNSAEGGASLCCNLSGSACGAGSDCCSASCDTDAGTCN